MARLVFDVNLHKRNWRKKLIKFTSFLTTNSSAMIGTLLLMTIPVFALITISRDNAFGFDVLAGTNILKYEDYQTQTYDTASELDNFYFTSGSYTTSDEISTLADQSGNSHDLSCVSTTCPTYVPGANLEAAAFDGSNLEVEDIDAEDYLEGLSAFTISLWVKSNTTSTDSGFVSGRVPNGDDNSISFRYDQAGLYGGCTNCIKAGISIDTGTSTGEIQIESSSNTQTTNWQHLALTWSSGNDLKLYIDGQEDTPSYLDSSLTGTITDIDRLMIGKAAKDASSSWDGDLDELYIWPVELNATEITDLYNFSTGNIGSSEELYIDFNKPAAIEDDFTVVPSDGDYITMRHHGDRPARGDELAWWDDDNDPNTDYNWRFRKCYEVDFTAGTQDQQEYQLYLDIDTANLIGAAKMAANGEDIRFVDENGNLLDHFVSSGIDSSSTKIWVQTDTLTAGSINDICMYYGYVPFIENPVPGNLPSNLSNRADVFDYSTPTSIYTVVAENVQTDNAYSSFVSYEGSNQVQVGGFDQTLNQYQVEEYPAASIALTETTAIATSQPISAIYDVESDNLAPASSAGTEFVYRMDRGTNTFTFISPWCNANVEVRNGSNNLVQSGSFSISQGGDYFLSTNNNSSNGITNNDAVIVESTNNCPILATHSTNSDQDTFVMYPASTEWYGVGSGRLQIAAIQDNTSITVYDSTGSSSNYNINRGDDLNINGGSDGTSPAQRVVADKPVGVSAIADSDGTEKTTFLPATELNYTYFVPSDTQYVAISSLAGAAGVVEYHTNADNCGDGSPDGGSQNLNPPNADSPGKAYFGSSSNGVHINAGACFTSDVPFFAYFEDADTDNETNLWGHRQNRQFVHPQPSSNLQSSSQNGNWNLGESNNWNRRYQLDLTNNAANAIGNYTFKVEIISPGSFFNRLQSDGGDLRVAGTTGDGSDNYQYWLESFDDNNNEATLWIEIPGPINASSTTNVYLYVDADSTATTTGDFEQVFSYPSAETHFYTASSSWINGNITGVSFADGNSINDENNTEVYDQAQVFSIPFGNTLSANAQFSVNAPLDISFLNDVTDIAAPLSFAGREFVYNVTRSTDQFDIYAPFGNASVEIFESSGSTWNLLTTQNVASGQVASVAQDIDNNRGFRITSDLPVNVFVRAGSDDSKVLYPVEQALDPVSGDYELYGVGSSQLLLAASNNNTNVEIYRSDGTQATVVLNNGNNLVYEESGSGSQGTAHAYYLVADGPIGATSLADGDGIEAMVFWGERELSSDFILSTPAQYFAIASPSGSNTCRVYDSSGNEITSGPAAMDSVPPQTGGSNVDPYPNKIFIGGDDTSDGELFTAGTRLTCNQPVFAYYEKHDNASSGSISDESNWLSYPQARKYWHETVEITNMNSAVEEGLYLDPSTISGQPYFEVVLDLSASLPYSNHTYLKSIEWVGDDGTPLSDGNGATPVEFTIASSKATPDCNAAIYTNEQTYTVNSIIPADILSDANCIRVRGFLDTDNVSVAPRINSISLEYSVPEILPDSLNSPNIQLACSITPATDRTRLIKAITDQVSLGSTATLDLISSSNTVDFSDFDLEFYNIENDILINQYVVPPWPSLPTPGSTAVPFDPSNSQALYLNHGESFNSLENVEISFNYSRDSVEITRPFEVQIDCS